MILFFLSALIAASPANDACMKQAASVMPLLKQCAAKEHAARDTELNKAYQAALMRSDPAGNTKLRVAELAWISFRDAECDYRLENEGGGQEGALVWSDCMLDLTSQRISQMTRKRHLAIK